MCAGEVGSTTALTSAACLTAGLCATTLNLVRVHLSRDRENLTSGGQDVENDTGYSAYVC